MPLVELLDHAARIAHFNPDAVEPAEIAKQIHQPIRFVHGTADRKIPIRHGEKIFRKLASIHKEWVPVPTGDHFNLWQMEGGRYQWESLAFLKRWIDTANLPH